MRRDIRLRYLNPKGAFPSGRTRYYYRRAGQQIAMPDFPPDHPEFLAQYAAAATPPTIPMPQSREHAEMMLLVAERYLKDKPT